MTPLKPCGTEAAYARHRYYREKPCEACTAAHNDTSRTQYHRTKIWVGPRTKATGWTITPARLEAAAKARAVHEELAARRREDYSWLRDQGEDKQESARRVGIAEATASRWYEPRQAVAA